MTKKLTSLPFPLLVGSIAGIATAGVYLLSHNIFYTLGVLITILLMASHGDPRKWKGK